MDLIKYKPTIFSKYFGLYDQISDKDALYDGHIVPLNQAHIIFRLSHLSFITGIIGLIHNHFWLGTGSIIGSFTSHLYWYKPTYGWRRNLDITCMQILMWLHIYNALYSPVRNIYLIIQIMGVLFYILGWYSYNKNEVWASTFSHSAVHICANLSIIILYTS